MTRLEDFAITRRWPAAHPDRIQLYAYPTPNGVKASIMLEETGLPYEAHLVTLKDADVKSPEFRSISANGKIPAIIDPDGPGRAPLALFESGAILIYLADRTGQFIGAGPADRYTVIQWLMWQMGGIGPFFGQLGYFVKFAGRDVEDPRPRERYVNEARRLLAVLDEALEGREWIAGAYSIADIAICPWLRGLEFYEAKEIVGWHDLANVPAYLDRFLARPAVQRGLVQPPRPEG